MTNRRFRPLSRDWLGLTIVLCTMLGCGPANDSATEQMREQILTSDLPDEISSLAEAYATFSSDQLVTVSGRIYADGLDPFAPDEASFTIIDLPKPGHNHEDPGDCPFCKRELENAATAIVQLIDQQGEVIPEAADQLLGLRENQDLVVTGNVELVGETLIIQGTSLHLLSEQASTELASQQHGVSESAG